MKAYIQYLDYSPVTGELYEPCGDGRNTLATWIDDAKVMNGKHRKGDFYNATCIYEGEHNERMVCIGGSLR